MKPENEALSSNNSIFPLHSLLADKGAIPSTDNCCAVFIFWQIDDALWALCDFVILVFQRERERMKIFFCETRMKFLW